MTAAVWFVVAEVAALLGSRSIACPPHWYALAARSDGSFRCAEAPPPGECEHQCDDDLPELVGWLPCRAGERALQVGDGRTVVCGGEA